METQVGGESRSSSYKILQKGCWAQERKATFSQDYKSIPMTDPISNAHIKDLQKANAEQETEPKTPKRQASALTTEVANTLLQASFPQHQSQCD